MNNDLERLVMDSIVRLHMLDRFQYLRFNQIAKKSGVKKSSLQRILPRLVNRGWIKKEKSYSWSGLKREGRIYHMYFPNGIEKSRVKEKDGFYIHEISNDLQKELQNLRSYKDIAHPYTRKKILRKGRLSGRSQSVKKVLSRHIPKEYIFYRLAEYPFFIPRTRLYVNSEPNPNDFEWKHPKGKKHFWKKCAKEIMDEIKSITWKKRYPLPINF